VKSQVFRASLFGLLALAACGDKGTASTTQTGGTTSSGGQRTGGSGGGSGGTAASGGLPSAGGVSAGGTTGTVGSNGGAIGKGGSVGAGGATGVAGDSGAAGSTAAGGALGNGGVTGVGGSTGGRSGAGGAGAGASGSSDAAGQVPDSGQAETPVRDVGSTGDALDKTVTFHNGAFWNDTTGKHIEAHGGGFLKVADTWYWFGEDKSGNSGIFKGVNCYASKDLVTWEFRNAVATPKTATQLSASDRIIERPKVLYNDSTKQYVMWAHYDGGNYTDSQAAVFTSPTVDGNYTLVKVFKPLGNTSRDCTLYKEDDGTAYFISVSRTQSDMSVYHLSDDYLDAKELTATLWVNQSREAPAIFKSSGTYFMITSGSTGWAPNHAQYATASAIKGPWSNLTDLGTSSTTWDSQPTYVIPIGGSQTTTYIYAGDHWTYPQLMNSQYIWLPLVVNGTKISMDYAAQWSLNLGTGRVN